MSLVLRKVNSNSIPIPKKSIPYQFGFLENPLDPRPSTLFFLLFFL